MNSFYSEEELKKIGFKSLGKNILLSRKTSIYGAENIELGNNCRIDDFTILSGSILIGDYVHIAAFCGIYGGDAGVIFEDFVGLSARSIVYAVTDDYGGEVLTNPNIPMEYKNIIKGKVVFKKHSLIGAGAIVLPGVKVGEGTSVGSMALINKDLLSWSIYVGIPAKKIKDRSRKLLDLEKKFLGVNIPI
ncbi:acyltransferase [Clostridium hydrogeniformans]|uniref:acyltransferase n=1 Tax=Clostridium hydrogeniformans TaxID=349933 RepID=UPI00048005F7|nr:acyltransferase [Clostridium hydrogeniformans]